MSVPDLTGVEGLLDVGAGGHMGGAALQQAQLDAADLGAGGSLDHVGQAGSQAAQLGMAEAVGAGGLRLGDEAAVGIVDALGHGDDAVLLAGVALGHVLQEGIHVEVHLGQVDEVGAVAAEAGQSGGCGEPAGMAAHALDDGDHAGVIHVAVAADFHEGGGDILGGGGEAGAVVGAEEVVVDGLGHAEHAALVADLGHVLADLVAGVHGVVAAVVEEIANVVLLEDLEDPLEVGIVGIGVGDLIAAGAQQGRRGVEHAGQLFGVFLVHDHEAIVQHAADAVVGAVDDGDVLALEGGLDDAVGAGVDDARGAAGLADNAVADKRFVGHKWFLHYFLILYINIAQFRVCFNGLFSFFP